MMDVVKWLIIMSYEYHCDVASYGTTLTCRAKADTITCQLVSQMQANWYLCLVYRAKKDQNHKNMDLRAKIKNMNIMSWTWTQGQDHILMFLVLSLGLNTTVFWSQSLTCTRISCSGGPIELNYTNIFCIDLYKWETSTDINWYSDRFPWMWQLVHRVFAAMP